MNPVRRKCLTEALLWFPLRPDNRFPQKLLDNGLEIIYF